MVEIPLNINASSAELFLLPLLVGNNVQITHNALRVGVPQEDFAIKHFDTHPFVSPDVSFVIADTADAIAAKRVPIANFILLDLQQWNRFQPETEGPDFDSMPGEGIVKTVPGHGTGEDHNDRYQTHCKTATLSGHETHKGRDGEKRNTPCAAVLDFLDDRVVVRSYRYGQTLS